jgi:hypothetical protein
MDVPGEFVHAAGRRRGGGPRRRLDPRASAQAEERDHDGPTPHASHPGADAHERSSVTGTPRALARRFRIASDGFLRTPVSIIAT